MPWLEDFMVTIEVNGFPAQEYENDDWEVPDQWPSITKDIEAPPGAGLGIRCTVLPGYDYADAGSLSFSIWLDGEYAAKKHVRKDEYDGMMGTTTLQSTTSVRNESGDTETIEWRFPNVDTLPSEFTPAAGITWSALSSPAVLGVISVMVRRKEDGRHVSPNSHCSTTGPSWMQYVD